MIRLLCPLIVILLMSPAVSANNFSTTQETNTETNTEQTPQPETENAINPLNDDDPRTSTPGFPSVIEQVLISGPKIEAIPIKDREVPVEVRILETYAHGTDFRYDIQYFGFVPGKHNLADYLRRENSGEESNVAPIDPIEIEIMSVLPEGQVEPNQRPQQNAAFNSFYLASLLLGGVIWLCGLFAILFMGRGKVFSPGRHAKTFTVADRLRPMLEKARAGELSTAEQAELERLLTAFWRKKLRLSHLPAPKLMEQLRSHNQAGPMLGQLEQWLHAPGPAGTVDIPALLEPYHEMSGEEI